LALSWVKRHAYELGITDNLARKTHLKCLSRGTFISISLLVLHIAPSPRMLPSFPLSVALALFFFVILAMYTFRGPSGLIGTSTVLSHDNHDGSSLHMFHLCDMRQLSPLPHILAVWPRQNRDDGGLLLSPFHLFFVTPTRY
jgi:hypothetical protein